MVGKDIIPKIPVFFAAKVQNCQSTRTRSDRGHPKIPKISGKMRAEENSSKLRLSLHAWTSMHPPKTIKTRLQQRKLFPSGFEYMRLPGSSGSGAVVYMSSLLAGRSDRGCSKPDGIRSAVFDF
jgi:hypothetical protein